MDDLLSRVESLARHSDSTAHYTRTYLTPAHQAAARQLAAWMKEAGMEVRVDAVGSVIGRYASSSPRALPQAAMDRGPVHREQTLLLGSHFDSVRNGGKYDGVLGILVPIAARRGVRAEAARRHDVKAAPCARWLQEQLAASVRRVGVEPLSLPSGAGHDAMVLAEVTDVGMLFVRCGAGGVSHNPAETVTADDTRLAERALLDFLRSFVAPA